MKRLYQRTVLLSALLLLGGCAVKEYALSEPKRITLKTRELRFSDVGFIRSDGDAVQAELFSAGQAVERFEINHLVCVSRGCMSKSAFNARYLSAAYPDALMQNVLKGEPIFEGQETVRIPGGFEQRLQSSEYEIDYRVDGEGIVFKDRRNAILVKIRDLPESSAQKENHEQP